MVDDNKNQIDISSSRAYLRELAIQRWNTDDTDVLAKNLVEQLLKEYPVVTTMTGAKLLSYDEDDLDEAKKLPRDTSGKIATNTIDQYAVIDFDNEDVFRDDNGNTDLRDKEGALEFAKKKYPKGDEVFLKCHVIKWTATHLQFQNKKGIFSLDGSDDIPDKEMKSVATFLTRQIKGIIEDSDPTTSGVLPRSVYPTIDHLRSEVERIRKTRIDSRIKWIDGQWKRVGKQDRILRRKTSDAPGGHNPAEVKLQSRVDYELVAVLLRLFHPTPIATVLCKSHLSMHDEESGEPRERTSLTEGGIIGVGEGDELAPIIKKMIEFNFSVQPIFNKHGMTLGTLELKGLTTFVTNHGWDSLPEEIDIGKLRELKILGRRLPVISPETTVEAVAVYLRTEINIDGVLFEWNEEVDSRILPDDCKGILNDGFHIVTSHDLIAYEMSVGSS